MDFYLSMILSENRFPLFGIMLWCSQLDAQESGQLADGVYLVAVVDESDADEATQNKFCEKPPGTACRVNSREAVLAFARASAAKPHAGGGLALLMEH